MLNYILNFILAMIIVILVMPVFILISNKFNFGQKIRELGPSSHQEKEGVPTMGGVIFLPVIVLLSIFMVNINFYYGLGLFVIFINWGLGVIDDIMIIKKASSQGINGWVKLFFQAVSGIILGIIIYYSGMGREIFIPFIKTTLDLGLAVIPFSALVMMATTNSVNLSDGLDGLAGGLTLLSLLFFLPFLLQNGYTYMTVLSLQGAGIMLGFLWYNFYPAQIFMGDAGSLMMGSLIAVVALITGYGLLLLLLGGIFVLEALSVIIQVVYYKMTDGKRVFKMTPLHHHFELSGWKETKVTIRFYIMQIIFGIIALITVYI